MVRTKQPRTVDEHMIQKSTLEALMPIEDDEAPQPTPEEAVEAYQAQVKAIQQSLSTDQLPVKPEAPTGDLIESLQTQIKALQTEMQNLRKETIPNEDQGESGLPWQYYKRPELGSHAGYIVYAPGGPGPAGRRELTSFSKYITKGFKAITGYGPAPLPSQVYNRPGAEFIPMLQKGGAREFPIKQILENRWHVNPPVAGVIFPQVEEVRDIVRHFLCRECDAYELWCLETDGEAQGAIFRHLRNQSKDGRHGLSREETAIEMQQQGFAQGIAYNALEAARKRLEDLNKIAAETGTSVTVSPT